MTGIPTVASYIQSGDLLEAALIENGHEIVKTNFKVKWKIDNRIEL